jgi:DHA2 family multidrug resistance protein
MALAPTAYSGNRWILLVVVMIGTFMSVLDTTIMNVALPHIMTSFGSNIEEAQWVTTGFLIASAVSMPLTTWMGRRLGYGALYITVLSVFTFGAALSATAWSLDGLIVARVVQGLGAGIVQPASVALLTRAFPPHMRGRAFGVWSIGVMVAPSLGPTFGGMLIEFFTWRAIFTVSVFVGLFALMLAASILSRAREEAPLPFDWMGYLTLITCLVSGLLTVANGQRLGWGSEWILAGGAVSLGSLLLFIVAETEHEHAIVPLRLFRVPDLSLSLLLNTYKAMSWGGGSFLLPVFLHQVQRRESIQIGLMMMPSAVLMALGSPITGLLTDRFGGRWLTVAGTLTMALALLLYLRLDPLTEFWVILYPQFVRGIAMALINTPVVTTAVNSVRREDASNASWLLNLSQRVGGAFSISILSTVLSRQTTMQQDELGASGLAQGAPSRALIHHGMAMGFSNVDAGRAARAAFGRLVGQAALARAFQNVFLLLGLCTLTAAVPAFCLTLFRAPSEAANGRAETV